MKVVPTPTTVSPFWQRAVQTRAWLESLGSATKHIIATNIGSTYADLVRWENGYWALSESEAHDLLIEAKQRGFIATPVSDDSKQLVTPYGTFFYTRQQLYGFADQLDAPGEGSFDRGLGALIRRGDDGHATRLLTAYGDRFKDYCEKNPHRSE